MPTSITYGFAFLFTILLFLSFTAIDQQYYYPAPIQPSPDLGSGLVPGMFLFGSVEVDDHTFRGYELALAPHAPLNGSADVLSGNLSALDTEDDVFACDELKHSDLRGSIAMVVRGKCSLFVKIANCQDRGALAVVISGDSPVGGLDVVVDRTLVPLVNSLKIPTIVLSPPDFEKLYSHAGEEALMWTLPPDIEAGLFRVILLLFIRPLVMLAIVLLIVLVNIHSQNAKKRSSPELVWSLPTRAWDPECEGVWHQQQCSICLEDFRDRCEVMTLPCDHEFHAGCISQWLLRRRGVCPLCLQEVQNERTPLLSAA